MYYFFELLEASRAVVNEFLLVSRSDRYATPEAVERLRVESPAEFIMLVPQPIALIVGGRSLDRLRKAAADDKVEDVRAKRIANDLEAAMARTQIEVHEVLRRQLQSEPTLPTERLNQLLDRELFRAVESLASQDIRAIEPGPPTGETV